MQSIHSKSQINKLGREIRDLLLLGKQIPQQSLDVIQAFRTSYKPDVAAVFHALSNLSKKIRRDRIVSLRIKRIESILSKIVRQPTMQLGNMGDIAGCRCIVRTEAAVRRLVVALSQRLIVKKFNDYLTESKEDGYRGYHLYVQSPINPDRLIEIQIRTLEAHNWSTLVEILDVIFNLKLKEGQIDSELNELLLLLSRRNSLSINEMKRVIDIDKKRNIYASLKDVFLANHVSIRKKWIDVSKKQKDSYFIIEVDEQKESHLLSFSKYSEAEKVYYEKFQNNRGSNFLLTHIEKPDYKKICIAYSNYILIRHQYLDDWSYFVSKIIEQNFKEKNRKEFTYYYDYVERNFNDRFDQVKSEGKEFSIVFNDLKNSKEYYRIEPLSEWMSDLEHQIEKGEAFKKSLEQMKIKLPENLWTRIFSK